MIRRGVLCLLAALPAVTAAQEPAARAPRTVWTVHLLGGTAWSDVRGRFQQGGGNLPGGYHLAGPAVQGGVGCAWALAGPLAVLAEARVTAAWAEVPVAGGSATVPNLALHVLLGLGWRSGGHP